MSSFTSATAFQTPLDIANRALQHCGANRATSFTDDSKNASSVAFVYDKARRAELRRNVWRFAIKRTSIRPVDTDTLIIQPNPWLATEVYRPGSIVSSGGLLWVSNRTANLGVQPGTDVSWDVYFGPLTAEPFDSSEGYYAGEHVYLSPTPGVVNVYSSLVANNTTSPLLPDVYDPTVTYQKGQVAQYTDGFCYQSLIDRNLGNLPGTYSMWNAASTYGLNGYVSGSDGRVYISMVANNTGNDPTLDAVNWQPTTMLNPWTPSMTSPVCDNGWVYQRTAVTDPNIIYPLGSGPASDSDVRNVFVLPANFLRLAPQDPKQGAFSYLGAPTGAVYLDWNLEGNYLTSSCSTPITLRFIGDITKVTDMDDMFCEGLGARIALEICEELTQSGDKLAKIGAAYSKFMSEARITNGIETGPVEPPEDDFITVRN